MDKPEQPEPPLEPPADNAPKKRNDTLVIVLMLLALACVGITAAIAFHDMSAPP
jgi:hypothetical protein